MTEKMPSTVTYIFDPDLSSAVAVPPGDPRLAAPAPQPGGPLDDELLKRMIRYWQAANYLTVGQIYLQQTRCCANRCAGAHQAAPARALGDLTGPEPDLRPPEPPDHRAGRQRHLPGRSRSRRTGDRGQRLPRGHLHRDLPGDRRGRRRHAAAFPPVLDAGRHPQPRQRHHPGLDPRGRRTGLRADARLRRGLRQPRPDRGGRRRRRRGRNRPAGRLLEGHPASSTRPATARCCRSCTSTATRSPTRPCSAACPDDEIRAFLRGNGYEAHFVEGDDPASGPPGLRRRARRRLRPHPRDPDGGAHGPASASAPAGRPSSCAPRRAGPGRRWSTATRRGDLPLASGAALGRARDQPEHLEMLEDWLRSYQPERCSTIAADCCRIWPAWRRRGTGAWAPIRTPTAASLTIDLDLPDFRDYALALNAAWYARHETLARSGELLRDIFVRNAEAELPPLLLRTS